MHSERLTSSSSSAPPPPPPSAPFPTPNRSSQSQRADLAMAPRGNWVRSKVTLEKLQPFVEAGVLPAATEQRWRIPGRETVPRPEPGESICFLSHLLRGVAYPYSEFFVRFLAFYNIRMYDLAPNSILALSCFVSFCECFLGCPPYFPLWLSLYFGKALPEGDESKLLQMTGGVCFQSRANSTYPELKPSSKVSSWRGGWFYLRNPTVVGQVDLPPFSVERSQPRNLNSFPRTEDESMVLELTQRGKFLMDTRGLKAINLYTCWLSRRLSPLKMRPTLMFDYSGPNDPSRDHPLDLHLQDLVEILPEYTREVPTSMDEGLLPYTAANQVIAVSPCFLLRFRTMNRHVLLSTLSDVFFW